MLHQRVSCVGMAAVLSAVVVGFVALATGQASVIYRTVVMSADGTSAEVPLGESALGWDFVATAAVSGETMAVLERHFDRWGLSVTGFIIYAHGPELNEAGLDCYASFSPNGIVPQRGPATGLHKDMPILRHDHDVNEASPTAAARNSIADFFMQILLFPG